MLVCAASVRPLDLGRNHQVLACGTESAGTVPRIYDPAWPDRDDIT
jgi:hypothetical protein